MSVSVVLKYLPYTTSDYYTFRSLGFSVHTTETAEREMCTAFGEVEYCLLSEEMVRRDGRPVIYQCANNYQHWTSGSGAMEELLF